MANLNKCHLIGRLTRDVETRSFSNGGKVAKLGFVVNGRKKDAAGAWVDDPLFLDVECFNRGDFSKLADLAETHLRKGSQVYIEGKLAMDSWTDKEGQKRQKMKVVADVIQFLDKREQFAPAEASAPAESGDDNDRSDIPF